MLVHHSDILLKLQKDMKVTSVVVTHNMELAACMSRRVTIAEGKLTAMP